MNKELRKVADEYLRTHKEFVDMLVLINDSKGLEELVHHFHTFTSYHLIQGLREKGFDKELTELCDKAGKVSVKK